MRITRDYALDLIQKFGQEVAKNAEVLATQKVVGTRSSQKSLSEELWRLQKALAYKDITPKDAVSQLHQMAESAYHLVNDGWRDLLRSMA